MRQDTVPRKVKITAGSVSIEAELAETATADRIWEILPVSSHVNLWGEEIYFEIPLETAPENPVETVELGAVAYWHPGKALCVFFGSTPVSRGKEIRPYSPVDVIGRVVGDPKVLRRVKEGEIIMVSRAEGQ